MKQPIFRFAPSPNGELHLGHAYSAFVTSQTAKAHGGRFLLRIEDIDAERCRPEYETRMLDDLRWLGFTWEEPVRRQSEHFATYAEALSKLDAQGLLYPCFASRAAITTAAKARGSKITDPDGAPLYPGLHRGLSQTEIEARKARGEPYALRLDMQKAIAAARGIDPLPIRFAAFDADGSTSEVIAQPERWGDAVLARKETPASYHLAVVVDDALQCVTHVTRGTDLFASTDIHRLLQILLGLPPPLYHHHRLIVDAEGRKLSKRHKDKSLRALRAECATPADIRRMVGLEAHEA